MRCGLIGLLQNVAGIGFASEGPWQKIAVPAGKYTVSFNGQHRDIYPGCVAPRITGDSNYSFYYKADKLVVFFNGGGACWDFNTCVASLQRPVPTYVPTAAQSAGLVSML